jgi:hypothetical protein
VKGFSRYRSRGKDGDIARRRPSKAAPFAVLVVQRGAPNHLTLMSRRRFYRIERELPYQPPTLPDLHRPAMPVIVLLLH